MLNDKEITDFLTATSVWNAPGCDPDPDNGVCSEEDVVHSRDTVEDFETGLAGGAADEKIDTPFGILHIWENVQRKKGLTRGNLYVMQFGEFTGSYFSGQ